MTDSPETDDIGHATIDPADPVIAGSYGTWTLTYTAGFQGVVVGGRIRVFTDSDTDWAIPQFIDPAAADYMSVAAPDGVHAAVLTKNAKSMDVTIHGRGLEPGEQLTLVYGDKSGGSPGSRAQTFYEDRRSFWILVDADGSGEFVTLADSPHVSIVGDRAVRLVVVAPSNVVVGEAFRVIVKAEDQWGNPSASYGGTVRFVCEGIDSKQQVPFSADDGGVRWVEGFQARETGTLRIVASDDAELTATSNPIVASEQPGEHQLLWADPHGGQVAANTKIGDFFRHARDVSGVHFVGYQRNADVTSPADWQVQQREERELFELGRFIPIPGYEWSGRTKRNGGHHNVYFRRHNQPIRRNAAAETPDSVDPSTELDHIKDVFAHYRNTDTIITPHVGGEHSDLQFHDPSLEPAVEMSSSHGSFEWVIREVFQRGYRLGFLGGSDCYTGRPGDDRPGFQIRRYAKSALTGIYCRELTLDAFFEAMRARRVYATTGARIAVRVDADGNLMGSEYSTAEPPTIAATVNGTGPIESVELFRGLERLHSVPIESQPVSNGVRVIWCGASTMTSYSGIIWDGRLQIDGGKLLSVRTLRFDSPRSHLVDQTDSTLTWQAWGCGYPMGLELELDASADAEIQVAVSTQAITGPAFGGHGDDGAPRRISYAPAERLVCRVKVGELQQSAEEHEIGVLDRKLSVSLASESAPDSVEFQFTDESPLPGVNAYWVRVRQSDLEMAWTSPVYVDFVAPVSG